MEIHKLKLTKLAVALGVSVSLSGCFSDNDKTEEPPVVTPPTQKVVELPAGTASEKQAGFFTIVVNDSEGNTLGTEDVPITVSITKNADMVVSANGDPLTAEDLRITNGSGLFAASLSEITADTAITLSFAAPGYFNNSQVVNLSADNTEAAETVTLVSRNITSDSVAIASEEKSVSELTSNGATVELKEDGTLDTSDGAPIVLSKTITKDDAQDSNKGGVQISIPSGSKMLTRNAEGDLVPLTSTPSLAVAYFNNEASSTVTANQNNETRTESAMDYFPGGLDLSVTVPDENDETTEEEISGSFTTAGFVAIELTDDAGNKVKEFGSTGTGESETKNSIEVKMQVENKTANACPMTYSDLENLDQTVVAAFAKDASKATDNAYFRNGACVSADGSTITSRQIKAGDIIPVWSYDSDSAQWSFESYGVAQTNPESADVFDVAVKVTHLSYWNLDFFNWREPNRGQCGTSGRVNFDIKYADGTTDNVTTFDLLVESQSGGYRKYKRGYEFPFYNKATIANPPSFSVFLQLVNNGSNVIDGVEGDVNNPVDSAATRLKLDDICALDGEVVVLTLDTPPARIDQKIKTQYACSNNDEGDVEAPPAATSTYAYLIDSNNLYVTYTYTDSDGTATLRNLVDGSYTMKVWDRISRTYIESSTFTTSSTEEIVVDIPIECTITEEPTTGATGGT